MEASSITTDFDQETTPLSALRPCLYSQCRTLCNIYLFYFTFIILFIDINCANRATILLTRDKFYGSFILELNFFNSMTKKFTNRWNIWTVTFELAKYF